MSFLNPLFLFALIAVGLPLIIHLLNLKKPRKVPFSTLAFFKELQKTTIRKIKIKQFLLLFIRLLAVFCLALVLARPFLPPGFNFFGDPNTPSLNAILLDNSISMGRINEKGPLFDQAKNAIRYITESAKENDRFVIQTTNGRPQLPSVMGSNMTVRKVNALELEPAGNYIGARLSSLLDYLENTPYQNKKLFIISDGQQSQFAQIMENKDFEKAGISATFINLGNVDVQNTYITKVESSTNMIGVGLPVLISVEIENEGSVPVSNQFLSLEFQDQLVGQYTVSLPAGALQTYSFEIVPAKTGSINGKVIIEGDDFTADNIYYFTIQVPEVRKILWVQESVQAKDMVSYIGAVLKASGKNDSQIMYDEIRPDELNPGTLGTYDAILLDGLRSIPDYAFNALLEYVQTGGGFIFFPSETGDIMNYNRFFARFNIGRFEGVQGEFGSFNPIAKATVLQEDHPVLAGLFEKDENDDLRFTTPNVYYYFRLKSSVSVGGFNILTLNNNDPLIRENRFGEGRLIISAIGNNPGWSDFMLKPLFAPFYYRAILYVASSTQGGFAEHELGNTFDWTNDINSENVEIEVAQSRIKPYVEVVAGGVHLTYSDEEWEPGWATVTDGERSYSVALNLERDESRFIPVEKQQISSVIDDMDYVDAQNIEGGELKNEISSSSFGKEIGSWFLLAGLLLLVLESFVATFYKAETVH